ncbi:TlpA disulfide reductase family protein [Dinghuibacter silviterrae]|uniref:Redoxin n=1 Tax=Dinghuibacter silviterrae TaxID=1539049 RepID=A0A4R8DVQ8_9BACT|nr:TlpA disulfide reductase family protein [Dinghuibacter silviterrae]TDX01555.1 redoxin [Dinghuibacter silviterrae]
MKYLFAIILLGAALCAGAQQTIPRWHIADLKTFLQTTKKPVIVNLWATFCVPCVQEIPYFESTVASYGAKVDLLLLSLDIADFYPKKITAFAQAHGFHSPIAWLDETDADVIAPAIDSTWTGVIPCSVFYNPRTGYRKFYQQQLTPEAFKQAVESLLR